MTWVSAVEAKALMEKGAVVVDVREEGEFARARIAGTVNVPLSTFTPEAAEVQLKACTNGQPLVIMCLGGVRSARACGVLPKHMPVVMMDGGLTAWKAAGLPVEEDAPRGGLLGRLLGI